MHDRPGHAFLDQAHALLGCSFDVERHRDGPWIEGILPQ